MVSRTHRTDALSTAGAHVQRRRGIALAIALFAIVFISVLCIGVVYSSNQEFRVGRNAVQEGRALAVAELGQNRVVADWNRRAVEYDSMKTGDTLSRDSTDATGWGYHVAVTRLNTNTYWLVSEGRVNVGTLMEARRRTGLVMRRVLPNVNFLGGLTTPGAVSLAGASAISGIDANPTGWTGCATPHDSVPGLATSDSTPGNPSTSGGATITGAPNVLYSSAAADSTNYLFYQTDTWASMVSFANIVEPAGAIVSSVAPVSSLGTCTVSVQTNWGEPIRNTPTDPCESYFPIVYGQGSLTVSGAGRGQGVLLVNGDLTLTGAFVWDGVVIVKGKFVSTGTGMHITGGVMAQDASASDTTSSIKGSSGIQYSRCALAMALASVAQPAPAAERAWADMF